jgi:NAD(P)-dependent dehydrogenase (short-subunit alcohol dehydrogenase family)
MSFDLRLKDRRALVTGGTRGVGEAVVETLRGAGARVVATGRSLPAQPAEGVHYVAADLSTEDGCATVADSVMAQFGGVDIVVNVVGGSSAPAGGFAALGDTVWWQELNQNLMPAVRLDRDRTGIRCHHPCDIDPMRASIARVDNRLRRGKGSALDL